MVSNASSARQVAIVGVGRAIEKRGGRTKSTPLILGAKAAAQAIAEAGIGRNQVGALFTGRTPQSYMTLQYNQSLLSELKIAPTFNTEVTAHGGGALGTIGLAAVAISSGVVDYALCVTNEASGLWLDQSKANPSWEGDLQFEAPYGISTPALYGQFASRYIHKYNIKAEQAARVAVENRAWAVHHPDAAMGSKGPITVDDVLASPMIASPFRLLDCAAWYPGGIATAVVLTRADLARDHDSHTYVAGFGHCSTHEWVSERLNCPVALPWDGEPDLIRTGALEAARQAYAMSGLTAADMDLIQTSAPFSYISLRIIEELGLCGDGEAGDFVDSGGIDCEGGLPFNTSGGYLSFGQVAQGLYLLTETIDQIHGRAMGKQVPDARFGLVHGHGGPVACHSVVMLSRDPAA